MHPNHQLIQKLYTAFQQKDYEAMRECYTPDAHFSDPVFTDLNGTEVGFMWEMLLKNAADLVIEFGSVSAGEYVGAAAWTATYTFSATGKKVVNNIKAGFMFENGKIKDHKDDFDFSEWAKQAFGMKGILFGKMGWFQKKVQDEASGRLRSFIQKHK